MHSLSGRTILLDLRDAGTVCKTGAQSPPCPPRISTGTGTLGPFDLIRKLGQGVEEVAIRLQGPSV